MNGGFGKVNSLLSSMKKKDDRMKMTTEIMNNMKMIKLYSWGDTFNRELNEKRNVELKSLSTRFIFNILSIASFRFLPMIQTSVVFATFIATGHTLDIPTAFTTMAFFNLV